MTKTWKMKPTITNLKKIARQRGSMLRGAEKGLLNKTASLQRKINSFVIDVFMSTLDISGGKIKNTSANISKINKASKLKKFFRDVVNIALFEFYNSEFERIDKGTVKYFSPFEPTKSQKQRILDKGGVVREGFLNALFENNQVVSNIQNTLRTAARGEQTVTLIRQQLTDQIKGKENKLGSLQSFHYQNGYNEFQAYARGLDNDFSHSLGLNYAIYAGGEIKTTRHFCDERNGKVFNREQIEEMGDLEWQGKKPDNDIFIDMGGFNCRHDWDFISFELAKRINPDILKSKYDK